MLQKESIAHSVIVTVLADEGHTGIAWNIGAALTDQITKGLREESGCKHTYGPYVAQ